MRRILQGGYYETPGLRQKKKAGFRMQRFFLCLGCALLIVSFILLYLWQHLRLKELGYELGKEEGKRKDLRDRNQELEIRVSGLRSLERIEEIARTRLGLVSPEKGEIILLDITPIKNNEKSRRIKNPRRNLLLFRILPHLRGK